MMKLLELPIESIDRAEAEIGIDNPHQTECTINPLHISDVIKYEDTQSKCSIRLVGMAEPFEVMLDYHDVISRWQYCLESET